MINVMFVTHNSSLRSTTSSLNAILRVLAGRGVQPVMLFRQPGPWQRELEAAGVPCYYDSFDIPEKSRPVRSARRIWRLARLVRSHAIDLIHCNEHETYPLFRHVARWTGRPIVTTLHWNLDAPFAHWAFRRPYQPSAIQFLSRVQLEAARPTFPADLGPERVKLLMSGLAIDDFLARGDDGCALRASWNVGERTVVLGTASAIKPRKRLEDFIRLIGRLRDRDLDVLGVIAGGEPYVDHAYRDGLLRLIGELGLGDRCRFVGGLDPVTHFFRAIDVAVNTAEMEILSMSLCESQACGKPSVAYDVGGNAEALGDPSNVVPFGDLDALEARVGRLVVDAGERVRVGRNAERYVRENFDAPVLAARQAEIYEEILGRPLAG